MPFIQVKGLGKIQIQGSSPNEEETKAIVQAAKKKQKAKRTGNDKAWQVSSPIYEGMAKLAGAPVDLVGALMGQDDSFGGSKSIQRGLENVGVPASRESLEETIGNDLGPGASIFNSAMREVGANIIPGMGVPAAGIRMANRAIQPAVNAVKGAGRNLAIGAGQNVGKFMGSEAVASAGAGAGANIANTVSGGDDLASMLGGIAGGVAPSLTPFTPTALAVKAARGAASKYGKTGGEDRARQAVAGAVEPHMNDLNRANAVTDDIEGFNPSLAESTGSPSLLRQQQSIEDNASGTLLDTLSQRRLSNQEAVGDFAQSMSPDASRIFLANEIPDIGKGRLDTVLGKIEDSKVKTAGEFKSQGVRQIEARTNLNKAKTGQGIREGIFKERTEARNRMSTMAQSFGLNKKLALPIKDSLREIHGDFKTTKLFGDQKVPRIIRELGKTLKNKKKRTYNFEDIQGLRSRIGDDLRDAVVSGKSRKKIATLTRLQHSVDNAIDESFNKMTDPGLKERWATFRSEYKRQYIDPFEQGAVLKVRGRSGKGFYKTMDEKVASEFFRDKPGMQQYVDLFKNADGTWKSDSYKAAMQSHIMDDYITSVYGKINDFDSIPSPDQALKKHFNWLNKNQEQLSQVSDIADELQFNKLSDTIVGVKTRLTDLDNRAKSVKQSKVFRVLKSSKESGNPQTMLNNALQNPDLMRSIVRTMKRSGEDDAVEGFRQVVFNNITKRLESGAPTDIGKMRNSLKEVLGEGHIKDMETVQKAYEMINRMSAPSGTGRIESSIDKVGKLTGQGMPQILSRVFAAQSGRTSHRYIMSDMMARFMHSKNKAQLEALYKEALYNPQVAKDIVSLNRSKLPIGVARAKYRKLNGYLFNLGLYEIQEKE